MASITTTLRLVLAASIGGLLLLKSHLSTFSNLNPNVSMALLTFYLLDFCTFLLAILLSLLHVMAPPSPVPSPLVKHLTNAARATASATLLLGIALMILRPIPEAAVPGSTKSGFVVGGVGTLVVVCCSVRKFLDLDRHHAGSFIPAFIALCVSTGILLNFDALSSLTEQNRHDPFVRVPIHLLVFVFTPLDFVLGMVLLYLRISMPVDGPRAPILAPLIEHLVRATVLTILTTVLLGLFMLVPLYAVLV